ncbi:MAG: hypothetical protein HOD64_10090 [Candidatus Cloacimonetes bacterium]|nr:hypothetical protein [Candidatus Cloacimonadota bacterium]MBT4333615.1 hypothetical protein [Candidatus Cloacimonadota bacterium]MBT4575037.1 hypothetical protein [Candidatus Cloacimonadota bacterium]
MKIRFKDVSSGIVEARAVIEIIPDVFINEVTILNKDGDIKIELPQKSFRGKDDRMHYLNILTFENENKETLWRMEIKEEYLNWRKNNKKVLVYEG